MGNLKGTGWVPVLEYLNEKATPEQLEQIKKLLSEEDRKLIFSKPILFVSWLDYGAYIRLMIAADKVLGNGDRAFVGEVTRYVAKNNLKGLYRFFLSISTVQGGLSKSTLIWNRSHDNGKISVKSTGRGFCNLKITDWPDIPKYHELAHGAYMEETGSMAGAKNIRYTHPKCMAREDEYCLFEFKWDE